jgi:hypothetical protein
MQVTTLLNRLTRAGRRSVPAAPTPVVRDRTDQPMRAALGRAGPTRLDGAQLEQIDNTTCGPMTVLVARALIDPAYARWLVTGDAAEVAERLSTEQRRIHRGTNALWPRRLGTTPWGLAAALNACQREVRYGWRVIDDTDPDSRRPAIREAVAAVAAGYPVPVLVGGAVPRHWVLLIDAGNDRLSFYNPSGRVVRLRTADVLDGKISGLGFDHLQGVVLPVRSR